MLNKRIIFALLYREGSFFLSRNFSLQKVGNIDWLTENFGFNKTCSFIDELIFIIVKKNPSKDDWKSFFNDISKVRKNIFVPITIGGGIRNLSQAKECFLNGADKILLNTCIYQNNSIYDITKKFGDSAVTVMVDYKKKNDENRKIMIESGQKEILTLHKFFNDNKKLPCAELVMNSIDKDGTGMDFDTNVLEEIPNGFKRPILLMGGAGKPEHIFNCLKNKNVSGIVTANLFNFLGDGLEIARKHSINKGLKLARFKEISL
mgnify:CR=1 FL=1